VLNGGGGGIGDDEESTPPAAPSCGAAGMSGVAGRALAGEDISLARNAILNRETNRRRAEKILPRSQQQASLSPQPRTDKTEMIGTGGLIRILGSVN